MCRNPGSSRSIFSSRQRPVHSSKEPQAAYRALGCTPAEEVREELAAAEPFDVQTEYRLWIHVFELPWIYLSAARTRAARSEHRLIKTVSACAGREYVQEGKKALEKNMIRKMAVVSLSSGIIGEPDVRFEVEIGLRRLKEYGLHVKFMPHALKGSEYVKAHPEKRAEDLLQAFRDPETDMILCAIGGDDTYRLLPYLFEHDELKDAVTDKVFLGFSDTTVNHLMLHKVGLQTFYGQAFFPDVCELGPEMLPYTRKYFDELLCTGHIREITPSPVWYKQRGSFTPDQTGKPLPALPDHGFELLQGPPVFSGKILGGCIDTIYDCFNGDRYADMPMLCEKYHLFPDASDWTGRILLLESSEEKPAPEKYRRALLYLKEAGIFDAVSGVLVGKPMDEAYAEKYKQLLVEVIDRRELPVLFNINVGHALPRCIIPFGVNATVDAENQRIRFDEGQTIQMP